MKSYLTNWAALIVGQKPDVAFLRVALGGCSPLQRTVLLLCGVLWLRAYPANAISPGEAQQLLNSGAKVTFVDIRPTQVFTAGHIPNAINIPASLIPAKQLPPLGRVIVYDSGLARDGAAAAAQALNRKPGIMADVLEGGLAAWEMGRSATTHASGMQSEVLPQITYQDLKKRNLEDVVLVDLREARAPAPGMAVRQSAGTSFTSLGTEFPGARVTRTPWQLPEARQGQGVSGPPLLVLIDNGDGKAQQAARALKAAGQSRFVILTGGEAILERKGAPGLQRSGNTLSVPSVTLPSPSQAKP